MFSPVPADTTLPYPRCRQVSVVGNSIHALRKNYTILGLISFASNNDFTDKEDKDDGLVVVVVVDKHRHSYGSNTSSSNGLIELGSHQDLRLTYVSCGFFCLRVIIDAIFAVMATMVHEESYFDEAQFDSKMKELFPSTSLEWSIPDMYKDFFTIITDAKTITAVIPYFGDASADRKTQGCESIAAKLVANLRTEVSFNSIPNLLKRRKYPLEMLILFISGLITTIGVNSSLQFFMKHNNFKGTISFGVGFFFVIIGWPEIVMAVEAYGFIILFRQMLIKIKGKQQSKLKHDQQIDNVLNFMWLKFFLIWRYFRFWALVSGIEAPENMPRCINN
ncbi:unnamed protein product [Lactuca saligna]|uniref:Ribose-phosphate pyrophosphokinase N-terminal domain-containing protein n=1 Tax=Lactuca saligna TaxID=75948 RepID=A0AA35VBS2_LACSI|nr:unnamed protein product [Lactuca saligna]